MFRRLFLSGLNSAVTFEAFQGLQTTCCRVIVVLLYLVRVLVRVAIVLSCTILPLQGGYVL